MFAFTHRGQNLDWCRILACTKIFWGTPPKSPRMCACVRVCRVRAATQGAGRRGRAHSPLRGSCKPLTSFWLTSVIDDDGFVICKITDDVWVAVARTRIVVRATATRTSSVLAYALSCSQLHTLALGSSLVTYLLSVVRAGKSLI